MNIIKLRHVEARLACQAQEQVIARFSFIHHAQQGRDEDFAFADADDVDKFSDRLRVEERRRAAHDDERMPLVALRGAYRNLRQAQQLGNVEIIGFKRNRDGQNVEVGDRG